MSLDMLTRVIYIVCKWKLAEPQQVSRAKSKRLASGHFSDLTFESGKRAKANQPTITRFDAASATVV
jgi:hypothetical protein